MWRMNASRKEARPFLVAIGLYTAKKHCPTVQMNAPLLQIMLQRIVFDASLCPLPLHASQRIFSTLAFDVYSNVHTGTLGDELFQASNGSVRHSVVSVFPGQREWKSREGRER